MGAWGLGLCGLSYLPPSDASQFRGLRVEGFFRALGLGWFGSLLGGSWVVISRVISRVTILITYKYPYKGTYNPTYNYT